MINFEPAFEMLNNELSKINQSLNSSEIKPNNKIKI